MKKINKAMSISFLVLSLVACTGNISSSSSNSSSNSSSINSSTSSSSSSSLLYSKDLVFKYTENEGYSVTGYTGNDENIVIPYLHKGEKVINIASTAFSNNSSIKSVYIPNSVTSIDAGAFEGCSSLINIEIPKNVTSIGFDAFRDCNSLESITIPFIGNTLDANKNIHFGYIFGAEKHQENSLFVPKSLKHITILGGKSVGYSAFSNLNNIESIELPDSVITIDSYAFSNCLNLKQINLPNNLNTLKSGVFSNCKSLKSINVPSSVTTILDYVFSGCDSLESIIVAKGNSKYDSRNNCNAIIEKSSNKLIAGCKNTIIPDTVKSIGFMAFYNIDSLVSIEIPSSIEVIGKEAFSGCDNLKNVTINSGVKEINSLAFCDCISLKNITIPNTVLTMGKNIFQGCNDLTIYCDVNEIPETWDDNWNSLINNPTIILNYK